MSMSIARAKYTGDPGLFDFFKGVVGTAASFIPVVGGGISQRIMQFGRQPAVPTAGPGSIPVLSANQLATHAGETQGQRNRRVSMLRSQSLMPQVPEVGIIPAIERFLPGGATGMVPASGCPTGMSGYHPNKSDYFLKSGEYVPAGTRMVKNRKRNPANARATSRAISRVVGAKRYAKSLSRISIRKHTHK